MDEIATQLVEWIAARGRCGVGFWGGVDSAVVAAAAQRAVGSRAVAVTAAGPSLPRSELEEAQRTAQTIGIRHRIIIAREFDDPRYRRNDGDRCYHCKSHLYSAIWRLASDEPFEVLYSGANLDDRGDFRPGLRAAAEARVRHPLIECGLDKRAIRAVARHWRLTVADKPASPCLASRIAYGIEVTEPRLRRIESAERLLHELGFPHVRVRLLPGDVARIELPPDDLAAAVEKSLRQQLLDELQSLGFEWVTLDLKGLESGNLNRLLSLAALPAPRAQPDA